MWRAILISLRFWAMVSMGAGAAAALPNDAPRLDLSASRVVDTWGGGLLLELQLSAPVPFAIGVADGPDRLELRLDGTYLVEGEGESAAQARRASAPEVRFDRRGALLSLGLGVPMLLKEAEIRPDAAGQHRLRILLAPAERPAFAAAAQAWQAAPARQPPAPLQSLPASVAPHVMLDPGHGGFDVGAEHGGVREADLVLEVAWQLAAALRAEGITVSLTRDGDQFVPLPERVGRANRAGADLFVSLHADAVRAGRASGASVHLLPKEAGAAADRFLSAKLGSAALGSAQSGDPGTQHSLMQLARPDSARSAGAAATALLEAMKSQGIALYKRPLKRSNFVVLRAADMPSLLVELGFLSDPEDRARLTDPAWRARMVGALRDGILSWAAP